MSDNVRVGFDEYFEKDYRSVVGFAQWLGAGLADAEDAAQTAFEALYHAWPKVENPSAYVRKVVTREVWRTWSRQRTGPWGGTEPKADPYRAEPDERDWVLRLLQLLPWPEKAALAWDIDGYSIAETAAFTGMSPNDVRNARRRAHTTLARLMQEH